MMVPHGIHLLITLTIFPHLFSEYYFGREVLRGMIRVEPSVQAQVLHLRCYLSREEFANILFCCAF